MLESLFKISSESTATNSYSSSRCRNTIMAEPTPATGDSEEWIFAGPTSSFLNVDKPTGFTPLYQVTGAEPLNACQILQTTASPPVEIAAEDASVATPEQILIFQYKDQFHAIDHQCPHLQHPLSRGKVYDIEDGAGIQCAKHGRAFNLSTGNNLKASPLKINIWETQIRDGQELWIRKQQSP